MHRAFGVYVHIPYCLQRCVYCDFATYEKDSILPSEAYIEIVKKEIENRADFIGPRPLDTLYFGGGTPSLLGPPQLAKIIDTLKMCGFIPKPGAEITLEINPATLDETKLLSLLECGFNRFSVGVQSFNEAFLKRARRKHSADQTRQTLALLKKHVTNMSLDLLFALPGQTTETLNDDLQEIISWESQHISPYYLTIPEANPLNQGRPSDAVQAQMFDQIESMLSREGFYSYEISNFAKPGFESRHNMVYWTDQEYWGIGLSAHSYLHRAPWGIRFWNPKTPDAYEMMATMRLTATDQLLEHGEMLTQKQSMTDFCHTHLRTKAGIPAQGFKNKFGISIEELTGDSLGRLKAKAWLEPTEDGWTLTSSGRVFSNRVFEEFTFI